MMLLAIPALLAIYSLLIGDLVGAALLAGLVVFALAAERVHSAIKRRAR